MPARTIAHDNSATRIEHDRSRRLDCQRDCILGHDGHRETLQCVAWNESSEGTRLGCLHSCTSIVITCI
jgi:hypothetical protein